MQSLFPSPGSRYALDMIPYEEFSAGLDRYKRRKELEAANSPPPPAPAPAAGNKQAGGKGNKGSRSAD